MSEELQTTDSTRMTWAIVKTQLCMISAGGPISALATQAQLGSSPERTTERAEKLRLEQLAQTQLALHNKAKRMKAILDGYALNLESDTIVRHQRHLMEMLSCLTQSLYLQFHSSLRLGCCVSG